MRARRWSRRSTHYTGAVVIVSHDRHMLELTADRLVLVDGGTAKEFDGSLEDYIAFVLAKDAADTAKEVSKLNKKDARRAAAEARETEPGAAQGGARRRRPNWPSSPPSAARSTGRCSIRRRADAALAKLTMTDLMKRRAEVETRIEAAEAAWLEASEALETAAHLIFPAPHVG